MGGTELLSQKIFMNFFCFAFIWKPFIFSVMVLRKCGFPFHSFIFIFNDVLSRVKIQLELGVNIIHVIFMRCKFNIEPNVKQAILIRFWDFPTKNSIPFYSYESTGKKDNKRSITIPISISTGKIMIYHLIALALNAPDTQSLIICSEWLMLLLS